MERVSHFSPSTCRAIPCTRGIPHNLPQSGGSIPRTSRMSAQWAAKNIHFIRGIACVSILYDTFARRLYRRECRSAFVLWALRWHEANVRK